MFLVWFGNRLKKPMLRLLSGFVIGDFGSHRDVDCSGSLLGYCRNSSDVGRVFGGWSWD